jgi:glycerol-3-phosphate dehydrogenase (NAD(P)+)
METRQTKPIAILGAGSWGTALALYLSRRHQTVRIWSIETSEIEAMQKDGANTRYLPGYQLPAELHPCINLAETLNGVDDVLMVVPSIGFRSTLAAAKPFLHQHSRIICATKGLEAKTGQLLSGVTQDVLGANIPFAVLSGPSFAKEVAQGLPTAVMIASETNAFTNELIERFNSPIFRAYPSDDVIGLEIGGTVKNVIAIATGILDGMGFGSNARCAVITKGLAEITLLGTTLGGKQATFFGLAGLGDLILTSTDNQSRNRRLGLSIGKGLSVTQAEQEIGQAIEGKQNAEWVAKLSEQYKLDMPICQTVWQVLQGQLNATEAVTKMLFQ